MANKKVNQLTSKPAVNLTDLFLIADPTSGQAFKTTISDLGTAIGSGVSSVNSLVGAVVLDTDDIQELVSPTNKWFTDTRARAAISAGTGISYNSGTGVITNAVTSGQIATALGYTPANGADYLPLAGGTMGGAIFGTIATFASSSSVTALGITLSGASGDGVKINHSAGRAFNIQSSGGGFGILINNETASTSAPFTIQKQGASVIELTDAGAGVFASSLSASSFVKSGGTSAQFLKADGSVDSSTYLTTGTASSTYVALTGNQTIAGQKTFSSSLYGTSGVFSGQISATVGNINGDNSTNALYITHNSSFNTLVVVQSGAGAAIYADGKIFANQFIKIGGSSTDFLKGDGSVDTNTYLTTSSASSSYLPLSGGTLTGALNGTSGTFTGNVSTSAQLRIEASGNAILVIGSRSSGTPFEIYNTSNILRIYNGSIDALQIATGSGAATFSSSVGTTALNMNNMASLGSIGGGAIYLPYTAGLFFRTTDGATARGKIQADNSNNLLLNSDNGGNVGIGTTSPSQPLEIGGTGNILVAGGGTIFSGAGALYVRAGSGGDLILGANNTNGLMRITSAGNMGIGNGSSYAPYLITLNVTGGGQTIGGIDNSNGASLGLIQFNAGSMLLNARGNGDTNHMQFNTGGSERMRITSGGNVGIGTTSPSQKLAVVGDVRGYKLIGGEAGVGAGNYTIFSNDDNVGYIDTVRAVNSGDFHFRFDGTSRANINRSTGAYTATSDLRLKTNILDSQSVLSVINQIKVRSYNWIENNSYEPYGLIAQELNEILPEYVYKPKTESESWGLSKAELVPVLIKAVQELKAELDTLKNK